MIRNGFTSLYNLKRQKIKSYTLCHHTAAIKTNQTHLIPHRVTFRGEKVWAH